MRTVCQQEKLKPHDQERSNLWSDAKTWAFRLSQVTPGPIGRDENCRWRAENTQKEKARVRKRRVNHIDVTPTPLAAELTPSNSGSPIHRISCVTLWWVPFRFLIPLVSAGKSTWSSKMRFPSPCSARVFVSIITEHACSAGAPGATFPWAAFVRAVWRAGSGSSGSSMMIKTK